MVFLAVFMCALLCGCREEAPAENSVSVPGEPVLSGSVCSDVPSFSKGNAETAEKPGLYGSYRSTDGATLTLSEDGTFSIVSVTVMTEIKNVSGDRVQIVETVNGTYSVEENICALQIEGVTVQADGMNGLDREQIEQGARLLAGNDTDALELYTRLLSGDVLTGQELYGENACSSFLQNTAHVTLNEAERAYDFVNGK